MEVWDGVGFVVKFPADIDARQIVCCVSMQTLQDAFESGDPLRVFRSKRRNVEAVAEKLITEGQIGACGSVQIGSHHLR